MAVDVEPKDLLRLLLGVVGLVGEFDPSCLATSAGQHLGLDNDLTAQLLGRLAGLCRGQGESPLRRRDPEAAKELLALVFVEIHRRRTLTAAVSRAQIVLRTRPLRGFNPPF